MVTANYSAAGQLTPMRYQDASGPEGRTNVLVAAADAGIALVTGS
jgi:hypothetical protein